MCVILSGVLWGGNSFTLGCGGGNANSIKNNIIIKCDTHMPQKNANPVCTVNLFWCAGLSWCILLRNPLSENWVSLCLRSVCCTRLCVLVTVQWCGSLSQNLKIIWVQILYLARLRSIVEIVRLRSQVETCEGAFRLNEEFEIHYLPKKPSQIKFFVDYVDKNNRKMYLTDFFVFCKELEYMI